MRSSRQKRIKSTQTNSNNKPALYQTKANIPKSRRLTYCPVDLAIDTIKCCFLDTFCNAINDSQMCVNAKTNICVQPTVYCGNLMKWNNWMQQLVGFGFPFRALFQRNYPTITHIQCTQSTHLRCNYHQLVTFLAIDRFSVWVYNILRGLYMVFNLI